MKRFVLFLNLLILLLKPAVMVFYLLNLKKKI